MNSLCDAFADFTTAAGQLQRKQKGQNSVVNVTRHLRIAGRVQGVGYRDALRREALAIGVAGWVRNRRDGTVEAILQGAPETVDAVLAWARRGPPAARVSGVDTQPAQGELERPYDGFDCLPTS